LREVCHCQIGKMLETVNAVAFVSYFITFHKFTI
jgi:hypothetical protein